MLFSFLEADLNAPKLLTKMEFKANPNMYFNGADGVHYLKLASGNYQIIFGESKAYSDLNEGISDALDSIQNFKNNSIKDDESGSTRGIDFEKGLLNAWVSQETFTDEEKVFIKSLIYPRATNSYDVDTAFAVFVLYDLVIDSKEKNRNNEEYRKWLYARLNNNVKKIIPNVIKKIETRKLTGHAYYFYIVPFEDMEKQQKDVLKKVVE